MCLIVILIFKGRRAIIIRQSIIIYGKVTRDPIDNNTDIIDVTSLYEILKIHRCSVTALKCKIAHQLIAPAGIKRVSHQRHQFNMRIVHLHQIRHQFFR